MVERGGEGGSEGVEWASFSAASIAVCIRPAVDSQLLHQNNKRRPHKGRSWAGRWQQSSLLSSSIGLISRLLLQKQSSSSLSLPLLPLSISPWFHLLALHYLSCVPLPSSSSSHLLLWNKSAAVSASLGASAQATKRATVQRLQSFIWLLIQR